jgi:hypothetical protein
MLLHLESACKTGAAKAVQPEGGTMSHATNRIQVTTPNEVLSGPQVVRYDRFTAAAAVNEPARQAAEGERPIDPMLLVYQERVETFRMIAAALKRGYRALTGAVAA